MAARDSPGSGSARTCVISAVLLRIAATALEQGLTSVTQNVDDFKGVEGLRILNPFEQGAKG